MIYEVYVMTMLLFDRVEQVARDVYFGAAEDADVDDKAGAVVGALYYTALKSHELASVYAHLFATAQRPRVDGYVAFGIADHTYEVAHLLVGDYGYRAVSVFGTAGNVDHEALDVWQKDNLLAAHEVGAADEDEGGEDDALNEFAAAVAPCAHLFLSSNINLVVFFAFGLRGYAFLKPLATKFFGVVVNYCDVPMFIVCGDFLHAYGAVGRCYRRTFNMYWCIAIHTSLVCLAQQNGDALLRGVHQTLQIYEFISEYKYFTDKNNDYSCLQHDFYMNLCELKYCYTDSCLLIIRRLATFDVLLVRVRRHDVKSLNIFSETIKNVAVGVVYFIGLYRREIYLRGVLGVVPHGLADDANGDILLFGSRGPRMARNIHGERSGDAGKSTNLFKVAVDAEHSVEILAALGAVFADDDRKEILCGRRSVGVDDGLHVLFPSYGELLPRLLAAVDNVVVAEVFFAQVGHVYKRHAAHIEREEEHVARKGHSFVGSQVEGFDAADVGKAYGAARGLVDTGVDRGERFTLRSQSFGYGLVVNAAKYAHIERRGVAAETVGAQPRLIRLYERGTEHGEADVGTVAKAHKTVERLAVSVGSAHAPLTAEHVDMPAHEGGQRAVDSRLCVAIAVDDVCCAVRQSDTVVFTYDAVEPLHLMSYLVVYGKQRGSASGRHGRRDEYAAVKLVPFVGKDAAVGAYGLHRVMVNNLEIQCAFAVSVCRHPEC